MAKPQLPLLPLCRPYTPGAQQARTDGRRLPLVRRSRFVRRTSGKDRLGRSWPFAFTRPLAASASTADMLADKQSLRVAATATSASSAKQPKLDQLGQSSLQGRTRSQARCDRSRLPALELTALLGPSRSLCGTDPDRPSATWNAIAWSFQALAAKPDPLIYATLIHALNQPPHKSISSVITSKTM